MFHESERWNSGYNNFTQSSVITDVTPAGNGHGAMENLLDRCWHMIPTSSQVAQNWIVERFDDLQFSVGTATKQLNAIINNIKRSYR